MAKDDDLEYSSKSKKKVSKKTDLLSISGAVLTEVNYKVSFFLFVIGVLIFSNVFVENILPSFPDTVHGLCTTTKGTVIQLIFLIVAYIILDLIVKHDIL